MLVSVAVERLRLVSVAVERLRLVATVVYVLVSVKVEVLYRVVDEITV